MKRSLSPYVRGLGLVLSACLVLHLPLHLAAQEAEPRPSTQPGAEEPKREKPPSASEETAAAEPDATKKPAAILRGKVVKSDRRTPLPAAVVYAISAEGTVRSSAPADARGRYSLPDLAPGTYRLAVATEEGVFALENPVGITSAHDFRVDLATVPAEAASFTLPGVDLPARGFTYILQGKGRGATTFWQGPKGIVILVASAVAAGLIVSQAGDEERETPVSPSVP